MFVGIVSRAFIVHKMYLLFINFLMCFSFYFFYLLSLYTSLSFSFPLPILFSAFFLNFFLFLFGIYFWFTQFFRRFPFGYSFRTYIYLSIRFWMLHISESIFSCITWRFGLDVFFPLNNSQSIQFEAAIHANWERRIDDTNTNTPITHIYRLHRCV